MKILITGGAGFIGSNFAHYWTKNYPKDNIVILDKLTYAADLDNLSEIKDKIEFIEGDISNPDDVKKAVDQVETIIHFAAESHVDRSIDNPFVFSQSNILGTHVLLETARHLPTLKRFHHISTDEVFGEIPLAETWKFNENSRYKPSSPYAASKAASDHLVRSYYRTFNLPVTISNCSNNYGPRMHPEKFIARSILRLLNGEKIALYSPGDQVRDWLYVHDHCRAIDLILHKGKIGETYCVGGLSEGITNLELAKTLLKILNLSDNQIEVVKDRPGHDVKYDVDWSKIKTELGWEPSGSLYDHLQTTVRWYHDRAQKFTQKFTESEAFYNKLKSKP